MRPALAMLLLGLLFQTAVDSRAGECKSRRLPDGTWTTECPSEVPPAPPAAAPAVTSRFPATCSTSAGVCGVTFTRPVPLSTRCTCTDGRQTYVGETIPTPLRRR